MRTTEIIRALRCSATVHSDKLDCSKCPYRLLEPIDSAIPVPPTITLDGIEFWESCDVDGIAKDAADRLEEMEIEEDDVK